MGNLKLARLPSLTLGIELFAAFYRVNEEQSVLAELDAAMVDALIDEVVLFNDGHYEVKLKYRDEMEELLLNAALWQKEAQRYA